MSEQEDKAKSSGETTSDFAKQMEIWEEESKKNREECLRKLRNHYLNMPKLSFRHLNAREQAPLEKKYDEAIGELFVAKFILDEVILLLGEARDALYETEGKYGKARTEKELGYSLPEFDEEV